MYSKRTIALSIALHAALLILLTVSIDFGPQEVRVSGQRKKIVQAVVVDNQAVAEEVKRLKAAEEKSRLEQEQRIKGAERKAAAAEKKRKTEERRLNELEAKRKRLNKQINKDQDRVTEQKRKAEEQKKRAEAARKRREQERAELERKRVERALHDDLAAEEAAVAAAEQIAADAQEIDRYVAAIQNRVRQSFTILPGLDGLSCTLRITLIPGGEVSKVEIVQSSGNATFDRQAETAVRKAAPLPVPLDPRLFAKMRNISFVFDPQN